MMFTNMAWIYLQTVRVIFDMDLHIIPECYVDTNLIETIVPTGGGFNHQKGCGTVAKVMKERFSDDFAVGIIDKDKQQLDYLKEFEIIHTVGNLTLYKHNSRSHYIIQIYPAIERFILTAVEECGLEMGDYDLPSDFSELKKASKTVNSKFDKRFKKLFRDLYGSGSTELVLLSKWVSYLKDTNYEVDLNEVKTI